MAELIKCDLCGKVMVKMPTRFTQTQPEHHRLDFDGGCNYIINCARLDESIDKEIVTGITIDICDKCYKKIRAFIDTMKKN